MDVFAAMADPVRRDLLRLLTAGPTRVVDLAAGREISRPAVSKHLRVLTDAGLVVADLAAVPGHRPVTAPVTDAVLDALDLEVRRVGRDRRSVAHHDHHSGRASGESA